MFQARTPGGSKAPKTPSGGDRFIPNRSATQFDLGHFKITTDSANSGEADNLLSPSQKEYQRVMSENLNGTDISSNKIISYKTKAPSAPEGTSELLSIMVTDIFNNFRMFSMNKEFIMIANSIMKH